MHLFHFSDTGSIKVFTPRQVKVAEPQRENRARLNDPLVWAVDDWHAPMYLFPRACPRVFAWPTEATTPPDRQAFTAITTCRMVAHIEKRWFDRLSRAKLYRYTLPADGFEPLDDTDGLWVSREAVTPVAVDQISDIPRALEKAGVELRILPSLQTLQPLWSTSLHVSAIRMGNSGH